MAQKIVLEVTVNDKGTSARLIKNLNDVGRAVDSVASSHTRASRASDDHFHRQDKGIVGTANSTKSFSKLAASINGDNNSLVGAYAALAANIFAVTAAFNALKSAAEVEQIMRGLDAAGARLGLTYSVTTQRVKEAAGGMLSLKQSATSTAQVLAAGFKSDDIVRLTKVAKDASFALGRDMSESMDRLSRGAVKLEPELLDELGIMVRLDEASTTYARSLGKTASQLTATEKRQGFMNAVLAEGELKFGGISDAAGGASGLTKLSATFADLTNTIFKFVNIAASPLAAMFSSSPTALLGGMLLFASSIKGQLLPGLVDMGDKLAKVARKAEDLSTAQARASVESTNWGKHGSKAAKDYFASVTEGTHTVASAQQSLDSIQRLSANTFGNLANYRINIYDSEIAAIRKIASTQAQAAAIQHQADAVTLASQKDIRGSLISLRSAVASYRVSVELASVGTGGFSRALVSMRVASFAASAGIRVLGTTLLTFLPWLGLITIAVGALISGFKFLYEAMVGKEVIAARKEFSAIMKSLTDKEAEYARIRASTAAAASKEVAANVLISNSINEQVAAIEKIIDAEKRRKAGKDSGKLSITDSLNIAGMASGEVQKAGYDKVLKESLTSPIKEVRTAAREAVKELGGIPKVLKDTETASKFLDLLKYKLGGIGDASKRVEEAFKNLNIAVGDFIKSATPTTPYDAMNKSLTESIIALGDANIEFAKGADGADKFAAVLSGIGNSQAVSLLSTESAKALATYKETGKISAAQVTTIQQELLVRQQIFSVAQNEAVIGASLVQLAQARVSKLNSFVALTASDTKKRMQAENAVLELQASQLDAQVAVLNVMLKQAEARLRDNIELRKSVGLLKDYSDLQQVSLLQVALATETAKPNSPGKKGVLDALNSRLTAAKAVVAEEERIRNLQASTTALQNQAAAIRMGKTSKAVQDAEGRVTAAQTALDTYRMESVKAQELGKELLDYELRARKTLGVVENQNYSQAIFHVRDTLRVKQHELELELDLERAKLRAQIARGANKAILEDRIVLLEKEYATQLLIIDAESRAIILESLGLKTEVERYELIEKTTKLLLDQADAISANIVAETELQNYKLRVAAKVAGRALTPTEERLMTSAEAQAALDAALNIADIKKASIDAEFNLLRAQYALESLKLKNANSVLQDELDAGKWAGDTQATDAIFATMATNNILISAYGDAVSNLGTQQEAATTSIDNNVERLREAVKEAGAFTGLSGGTPNYVAATTSASANGGSGIRETLSAMNEDLTPFMEELKKLGPDGEYVSAIVAGSLVIADSIAKIGDSTSTTADKLSAVGSIIGQIGAILKASSDAKIANIDREISAEQARDGKSSESLARIKAMEAKKDAMARKAFETNKKIMMAQAVIATATGITQALALPFPMNFIMAGIIGAMGAAQLAVIAGTSYQSYAANASSAAAPTTLSIGKRSDSVDLAKNNTNVGGELGYLTGSQGQGSNASNFARRAYGGYGHAGMIVGEKGPEIFVPDTPGQVVANDNVNNTQIPNVNFHINAIDAQGVEDVLTEQRGHIIGMLREAANADGQQFLENVNTAKYRRRSA